MSVTKCECFDILFTELKQVAEENGVDTLEKLQECIQFGLGCGMCHPYVRNMLKTGKTEFEPFSIKDDE